MSQPENRNFNPLSIARANSLIERDGFEYFQKHILQKCEDASDNSLIAIASSIQQGLSEGSLAGVPFAVKDNIDALPFNTTGGCPGLKNNVPPCDAPAVSQLKAAGAWLACKPNLHELAFGITSNNAQYGAVKNPFFPTRVAGGSSGGNAAAIANGLVCFALGTDTGGSTRIPAAFCGVAGFRPSSGRYLDGGVLTLSTTRDTIGPMASNCYDLALVDQLLAPHDAAALAPNTGKLRIGLLNTQQGWSSMVDDGIAAVIEHISSRGIAEFIAVREPLFDSLDSRFGNAIVFNEAFKFWQAFCSSRLDKSLEEFAASIASLDVRGVFQALPDLAIQERDVYKAAKNKDIHELQTAYEALFDTYQLDLIAMPTVSVQPPMINEDDNMRTDVGMLPTFSTVTNNTALATLVGSPSVSIPVGFDGDGLPLSLMLEGRVGYDRFVLNCAIAIESLFKIA